MCGLVGFVSLNRKVNLLAKKSGFISQGLYLAALRGMDASGIALCEGPSSSPFIYKKNIQASDFIQLPKYRTLMNNVDVASFVMGHARAATVGTNKDFNAHPFQYGPITLCHNGTLHGYQKLANDVQEDTDSAYVAKALAENDAKTVLEQVKGAYCFVWHDSRDSSFNVAKNADRSFYWMPVDEWNGLIYASEMCFLGALMERLGIKGANDKFLYPENYAIYKFQLDTKKDLEYNCVPFQPPSNRSIPPPHQTTNTTDGATRGTTTTTDEAYKLLAKKNLNSGRPTSKKGLRRATERLAVLGIKFNDFYGCRPLKFFPYKGNGEFGLVSGILTTSALKHNRMEMHNVKKHVFEALLSAPNATLGQAVNVNYLNNKKEPIVVLEPVEHSIRNAIDAKIFRDKERSKSPDSTPDTATLLQAVRGPHNRLYSQKAWLELVEDGCVVCQRHLSVDDAANVIWTGLKDACPVCPICAKSSKVLEDMGITDINKSLH